MLTGSNTLSLPSPLAVFAQLFSIRFLHYLGVWNRLESTKIHSTGTVSECTYLYCPVVIWKPRTAVQPSLSLTSVALLPGTLHCPLPGFIPWTLISTCHMSQQPPPPPPPPPSLSVGSFSNDDGDGKENVKTAIGLLSKTTSLHVQHAFLSISLNCRYCATTT